MNPRSGTVAVTQTLLLGPLSCALLALAQDWYVDASADCMTATGSQTDPFCNIQDAVDAAVDGDTIHIAPGIYLENVLIDKDLELIGTGGQAVTTVDGNASAAVVTVTNTTVSMTGLALTNGFNYPYGSGLHADAGSSVILTNTTVSKNLGHGIYSSGTLALTNSSVSCNGSVYFGDGIHAPGAQVSLSSCTVNGNGERGVAGSTSLIAIDSTFNGNNGSSSGFGGGIAAYGSLNLVRCTISGNSGRWGGGISAGGPAALTDSIVSGNNSSGPFGGSGGGIFTLSDLTLTNCTVSGNTTGGDGGGVFSSGSVTLMNSTVSGNAAGRRGGGLSVRHATLTNSSVSANTAYGGGGIVVYGELTLTNTVVSNNTAYGSTYGGYQYGGIGGGILVNADVAEARATLTNSTVTGNTAGFHGGGIGLDTFYDTYFMYSYSTTLTLTNSTVSCNTSSLGGDAIYAYADAAASCSTVAVNSILWDNGTTPIQLVGSNAGASINHSVVEGGWAGTGNLDADPLFVDPMNGDYRLLPGSPCIDAGNNLRVPTWVWLDADGNLRFHDDPFAPDTGQPGYGLPIVDMGAYEFGSEPPNRLRKAINVPVPYAPPRVIR